MSLQTSLGTENLMRWDRASDSFMEVWYASITDPLSGWAFWIRYTITSPQKHLGDPYCEMWAVAFDPQTGPAYAGKQRFSTDRLGRARDDGSVVRIADSWLSETHLDGSVEGAAGVMSWSLGFEPSKQTFHHMPPSMEKLAARRASALCSPNLDVHFTGTVVVAGKTFELDGAPGAQTHRWGHGHPLTWAWAHCAVWDDAEDTVFEGVAGKASFGPLPAPTSTFLYLSLEGESFSFNDVKAALRARSAYEMPTWTFTASNKHHKLVGASRADVGRFLQLRYADPDTSFRHAVNSGVADLALQIYRREGSAWALQRAITATRSSHLEFGRREAWTEPAPVFT